MNAMRWRAVVVLLLALASFAGAQAWRPTARLADTRPKVVLAHAFPTVIGEWRVDNSVPVQLVSPDTQAMLNQLYNDTLSRVYVNAAGERIMLSVAYGGDQSDATRSHRPEVCYPAQGFQIISSSDGQVDLGGRPLRVRRLVSKQGGRIEPISYWITVGDKVTLSGTEQKLAQLSYSTRGVIPDGMLVRVSSINTDVDIAFSAQQRFIVSLAGALPTALRPQILGYGAV